MILCCLEFDQKSWWFGLWCCWSWWLQLDGDDGNDQVDDDLSDDQDDQDADDDHAADDNDDLSDNLHFQVTSVRQTEDTPQFHALSGNKLKFICMEGGEGITFCGWGNVFSF